MEVISSGLSLRVLEGPEARLSSLDGPAIEVGCVEVIGEDFHHRDAAPIVEELEGMAMTGGVGVCDGSSRAKRFEEWVKGMYLIGDFQLPLRVGGEPGELVYGGATSAPSSLLSSLCVPVSAKTRCMFVRRLRYDRTWGWLPQLSNPNKCTPHPK